MGKTLVVYYSLDGGCRFMANIMKETLSADIAEIELDKPFIPGKKSTLFFGGMQTVFKMKPAIKDMKLDFSEYELIIIGTPVWVSTFVPAVRTFLSKYKIMNKKVALFCSFGGDEGKTFINLKYKLHGNEFIGEIGLKMPNKFEMELSVNKVQEWSKTLLKF